MGIIKKKKNDLVIIVALVRLALAFSLPWFSPPVSPARLSRTAYMAGSPHHLLLILYIYLIFLF